MTSDLSEAFSSDDDSDSSDSNDDNKSSNSDSSVDSDELDDAFLKLKPSAGGNATSSALPTVFSGSSGGILDLSDTSVVYRAIHRFQMSLGQTQAPCGKCPQFVFCEEDGPVNPAGCQYYGEWLSGAKGGWDADARKAIESKKDEERQKRAKENGDLAADEAEAEDEAEDAEPMDEDD
jgi:DNA-directed RNA polymerase III subunit RPC6